MTGKELERLLSDLTNVPARDLDTRARELRKLRMVPSGPRGRNAPDFAPEHIAKFLIAVSGIDNASHAGRAVMEYAPLVPAPFEGEFPGFDAKDTFADVLTRMIENPKLAEQVSIIRVCRTYPAVEIEWIVSDKIRQVVYAPEGWPDENAKICALVVWCEFLPVLIQIIADEMEGTAGDGGGDGGGGDG